MQKNRTLFFKLIQLTKKMKKLYSVKLLINYLLFLFISTQVSCDFNKGLDKFLKKSPPVQFNEVDDDEYDDEYGDEDVYDGPILYYGEVHNTFLDKNAPYLNMRAEPNSEAKLLDSFSDGTRLAIIDKGYGSKGLWLKVYAEYYDERGYSEIGYVHSKWVRFKEYAEEFAD